MEKTIEEKVLGVLAARGEAYRVNLELARQFLADMNKRGVCRETAIGLLKKVEI